MKFNLCIENGQVMRTYDNCIEALQDALFATEETGIPHYVVPDRIYELKGINKQFGLV